jgi:hypothetical protein
VLIVDATAVKPFPLQTGRAHKRSRLQYAPRVRQRTRAPQSRAVANTRPGRALTTDRDVSGGASLGRPVLRRSGWR